MGSPLRERSGGASQPGVFASDSEAESASATTLEPASSDGKKLHWIQRFIRQRLVFKVLVALRGLSTAEHGRDYSDRIHPCVMLESRRVVRTSLFIAGFLALHMLAAASFAVPALMPHLLPGDIVDHAEYKEWIFWGCIAFPMIFVLPGAALFGLSWDIHVRALETMLMTRLTPFGIVYGKWMSKAVEALLMASALMPYMMARYYLSGSNPVTDTLYLIGLIFVSGCLSAMAIALSTVGNMWIRLLGAFSVLVCCVPIVLLTYVSMEAGIGSSSGYGRGGLGSVLCVVLLAAPIGCLAALGIAASGIGPMTYNGSYIARKCAILLTLPWALGVFMDIFGPALMGFQLFGGLMLFVPILLEDMRTREELHVDVRIATASGIADDSLVMPGWQTGVWWVVGSLLLWLLPLSVASEMRLSQGVLILVPAFASIFFPLVIIRAIGMADFKDGIFCMKPATAFVWYFLILAFTIGVGIALDKEYIQPWLLMVAPPMQTAWTIVWTTENFVVQNPWLYLAAAWPVPVLLILAYHEKKLRFKEAAASRAKLSRELLDRYHEAIGASQFQSVEAAAPQTPQQSGESR
ncbi:MAG: hypothetical protein ACAI35_25915 [Candidatus Methylacidiphilales bacterium]